MPRTTPFRLAAALLLAALLVACGAPQGSAPAGPTAAPAADATAAPAADATAAPDAPAATDAPAAAGGSLRVGRTAAPDSLNPGVAYLSEAYDLFGLVYDTLITTDLRNQPQPQLAKEYSVAEDGKTWTFKLNEGVMWHDGTPLTAEDVAFTFTMIKGFDSFATLIDYVSRVEKAEATDASTVVITFDEPVANTTEIFSGIFILPKHIWQAFKTTDEMSAFENLEMVGSGPFKLAEYTPGEFARLTANKEHYLSPPKIDEVIFKVYGNDDAMVQALKTGEIDLMSPTKSVVRVLQSEPNVKVEIGNQRSLVDIMFNITTAENCPKDDGKCTGHPALKDVKVRQALAHATDKQQLIDTILLGLGTPGLSLVTPAHGVGFNSELQDYAYDVEKAKALLDEAGYADSDGDGIREMPGDPATPLNLRYSYPSDQYAADGPRFAELLRGMWNQVGVELTIQPLEADALTAACCPAFDFDVIQWGWGAGSDPASLLSIVLKRNIPTGTSETGYANDEFEALYTEQETTIDAAKRTEIIHTMQEVLVRDVPYIIPYYPQAVMAYRTDRFQGWVIDPEGVLALVDRISLTAITAVQ